jgi:hypothetical protein
LKERGTILSSDQSESNFSQIMNNISGGAYTTLAEAALVIGEAACAVFLKLALAKIFTKLKWARDAKGQTWYAKQLEKVSVKRALEVAAEETAAAKTVIERSIGVHMSSIGRLEKQFKEAEEALAKIPSAYTKETALATNTSKSLRGADKVRDGDLTTEYREAQAALDLINASLIEAMTKLADAREKL